MSCTSLSQAAGQETCVIQYNVTMRQLLLKYSPAPVGGSRQRHKDIFLLQMELVMHASRGGTDTANHCDG